LEDDVRIAQQFKAFTPVEMDSLRKRAEGIKGPGLEDWKRNINAPATASSTGYRAARQRHG
jgi:hypothetical protein